MTHRFLNIFRRFFGMKPVYAVTLYFKSGAEISVDVTDWSWKAPGTELFSYSFVYHKSERDPLRYIRVDDVSAISVSL